jgi:hypothetical protein
LASLADFAPVTPQLSAKFTFLADASLLVIITYAHIPISPFNVSSLQQRVSEVISYNESICIKTLLDSVEPLPSEEKEPRLLETCEELGNLLMQSTWPGFDIPLTMNPSFAERCVHDVAIRAFHVMCPTERLSCRRC